MSQSLQLVEIHLFCVSDLVLRIRTAVLVRRRMINATMIPRLIVPPCYGVSHFIAIHLHAAGLLGALLALRGNHERHLASTSMSQ